MLDIVGWQGWKREGGKREGGVGVIGVGDAPSDEELDDDGDIDGGGIFDKDSSGFFE